MRLKFVGSVLSPALLATVFSLSLNKYTAVNTINWCFSIIFLAILAILFNTIYLIKAAKEEFTQLLIVVIVIKFLLALIAIVGYSFYNHQDFLSFSLHFISHYILFTIFEIRYLLNLMQQNKSHAKT